MAGRRPKPDELKRLAGNPGHRPLNDAAPQPPQGAPQMPRGLSPVGRREWDYMCEQLAQMGMLYRVDGKALYAYCDAFSMVQEAERDIRKHGLIYDKYVQNDEGENIFVERKASPAVQIKFTALKVMKSFLIEFGLTPASRSKLKIEPPKAVDPMEQLLNRNKGAAPGTQPAAQPQPPSVPAAKEKAPLAFDTGKQNKLSADIPDVGFDA